MQVYDDGDELASIEACSHSVIVKPHVMKIDSEGNRVFFSDPFLKTTDIYYCDQIYLIEI
jgi:hypothetical protein